MPELGRCILLKGSAGPGRGDFYVQAIGLRPKVRVSADGSGVFGHAEARLLADLAHGTGRTAVYCAALKPLRPRGPDMTRAGSSQIRR